jgi:hypothetical protein
MTGSYEVIVQNRRLQYKFTISRNITILRGDSATGKTTLIEMIRAYQLNGEQSGINISCKKKCVSLEGNDWQILLNQINDSIVFIDEGNSFVYSQNFAEAVKNSSNYYVIAVRNNLFNLPYSITEIYGIENVSGNKYQGTKRLYSRLYNLYEKNSPIAKKPELVIVEDAKSGYEFFKHVCDKFSIPCVSAMGKSKISTKVLESPADNILVIADGAAFGSEIESLVQLRYSKNIGIYLPESFEWLILNSGLIKNGDINQILENPSDYIDSKKYFSWEVFFTDLLIKSAKGTYLEYSKSQLNVVYKQENETNSILSKMPKLFE